MFWVISASQFPQLIVFWDVRWNCRDILCNTTQKSDEGYPFLFKSSHLQPNKLTFSTDHSVVLKNQSVCRISLDIVLHLCSKHHCKKKSNSQTLAQIEWRFSRLQKAGGNWSAFISWVMPRLTSDHGSSDRSQAKHDMRADGTDSTIPYIRHEEMEL